jgi:hypothetical protein
MSAFGSVVEHIGTQRGLPAQTMTLNRRVCGLLLNSIQLQFMNGYCTLMDTWPVGPDNGTYRARDGRHLTMIGLHPHLRDGLLSYFGCPNDAYRSARRSPSLIPRGPKQGLLWFASAPMAR